VLPQWTAGATPRTRRPPFGTLPHIFDPVVLKSLSINRPAMGEDLPGGGWGKKKKMFHLKKQTK